MLNDQYSHDYYAKQIHVIKAWALNLGAVYLVLFIVVDFYRYSGPSLDQALVARVLYMLIPFCVVISCFYKQKKLNLSHQQIEWLSLVAIILVGLGHTKIIEIGANHAMFFPRIGLTIVLIYSGLLLALPIKLSILSSSLIILLAALTYHDTGLRGSEIASLVFFYAVFSSCCIFMNHVFNKILSDNHQLMEVIDQQANTDDLTKLYNRRYFYNQSNNIRKQSTREQTALALMLIDLDNFKTINDELGHKIGDETLIKVAQILKRQSRRPMDVTARLGGDEFVILMHDSHIDHIKMTCINIINDINQIITALEQSKIKLGVSIGVAFNSAGEKSSIKALMEMADQALYHVKHHGKNNYCIYSDA